MHRRRAELLAACVGSLQVILHVYNNYNYFTIIIQVHRRRVELLAACVGWRPLAALAMAAVEEGVQRYFESAQARARGEARTERE